MGRNHVDTARGGAVCVHTARRFGIRERMMLAKFSFVPYPTPVTVPKGRIHVGDMPKGSPVALLSYLVSILARTQTARNKS